MRQLVFLLVVGLVWLGAHSESPKSNESVAKLVELFGGEESPNRPKTQMAHVSVERGRDLVLKGNSRIGNKRSKQQSIHFPCTACHNIDREDPDLADPNPTDRLVHAAKKDLPFLQGSPFYGIVNRTKFYNGDYEKKYGDLVKPTRNDIREAIQLCAVECSQGRPLQPYEVESVLAYLWTLELTLADLDLTEGEEKLVNEAYQTGRNKNKALEIVTNKYLDYSPATFLAPITGNDEAMKQLQGDPASGQHMYQQSCQHCHFDNNYSYLLLDEEQLTFKYLLKNMDKYRKHSLGQVVRYGTSPKGGKNSYMPLYPEEKMTNQQLADLRAYIELKASQ